MTAQRERKYRMATIGDDERVKVVPCDGVDGFIARFTTACSGCYTPYEEGGGGPRGSGCSECGYTGKRRNEVWLPLDYEAWEERARRAEEPADAPLPERSPRLLNLLGTTVGVETAADGAPERRSGRGARRRR